MASKFLKHKWQKVVLTCLLLVTAIVLFLAFLINIYWSPILSQRLKSVVLTSTDSLYNIDFSSAELHVLQGRIVIYNLSLKPDTAVYNRRIKKHTAPNNLVNLHVRRLILSQIHPFQLYFKRRLDIGRITLSTPDVHMRYQLNHTKDTISKDHRTVWQKVAKTLKSIHVSEIFLNDINFKYDDYSGNKLVISELKEMNLQASDLLIDSATQTDKSRMLYCKDVVFDLNNYKGKTTDGLYSYTVKRLKLSTQTSQLNAEGLTFAPTNTATFFNKTEKDRYIVKLDSLQLNNFDFLSYHKYRSLTASSLILSHGSFDLFNNPNKAQTDKDKIKSFPNMAMSGITTNLKIDTITTKHIDVSYSEHNKKSDENGTIYFYNTEGTFLNVTNNKEALQKNNITTAQLTTYFMNRGKLNLFFSFNLTDKDASYSYKGNLGPMNLSLVNQATIPFAMVKVASGKLKAFNFDIKANSKVSKGNVTLLYNDLKVTLLKSDSINQKLKRKIIATLFANIFILKHNNPDNEGEIPRSFNVVYKRPVNSPFFKTIWQTLLLGIKPAVGYDEKTQHETTAKIAQSELNKKNRKIKKVLRLKKREERKLKRKLKKEEKAEQPAGGATNP
jgi:hypothetical protein